jgi:hypothetical protein
LPTNNLQAVYKRPIIFYTENSYLIAIFLIINLLFTHMTKKILFLKICLFGGIYLLTASNGKILAQAPLNDRPPTPQAIRETVQSGNQNQAEDQMPTVSQERANAPDDGPVNERAQIQIQQAEERAEQSQERVRQMRTNVAAIHAARLEKRFSFYYQRLTKIAEKIEARLQVLADEGVDVSAAQQGLTNALLLLEEAMERSNAAIADFKSINPEQYQTQRQIALQARDEARQSRQLFMQAMQELRGAVQAAMEQVEVE